jgi:hypothetical protein
MPAPPLTNALEGAADGVAVSTTNSLNSGNAFQTVGGTAMTYTNVHAHSGTIAAKIVDAAIATQCWWTGLGSFASPNDVFFRMYLYLTAYSGTGECIVMRFSSATPARCGLLSIRTSGNSGVLRAYNAAAASVAVGTHGVPLNNWFRLEARVRASTTVGEIEWQLYDPDDMTLTETVNTTGLVLAANVDQIAFGLDATTPTTPYTIYMDDVATSSTGWVGPTTDPQFPPPLHFIYLRANR